MRQLRIFSAVAEERSFSRAAKRLYLTQPAVSIQVRQLEERVGMPLLDRSGRDIRLTEAGAELLVHCRAIERQLDEAQRMLDDLRGLRRGRIHLTMAATANYFAPQMIVPFHRRYPEARITIEVANRAGLIAALEENRSDMVIMGRPPEGLAVEQTIFCDNPLVAIAAPDHPLAGQGEEIPLERLLEEPFIMREADSGTRIAIQRFLDRHGLQPEVVMEMNRTEAVKQTVMAGLGVGIVSLHTLDMELRLRRLAVLPVAGFPIMRHWYLVHREGKRLAAMARAFKEFVLSEGAALLSLPRMEG
ncbi:MAG: LysR family transcriptional regulator [Zetaproteobacteria bacterium]|nr:MAG: LysR family transcriptional regulator [Zetaproteobacteria bacterium]